MIRYLTLTLAAASLTLASCATAKKDCSSCPSKAKSECCSKGDACCKEKKDCSSCKS
ncbi:MAG: hypothetical protein KDK99_21125 [Verrucomicrobiales bacterium]|nr:hypothetical protein [Verrucomicrobiales bacterium]